MAKPSKKVVLGILDKLKLDHSSKITLERAQKKLEEAIESGGIPEDVSFSKAEIAGLEQMGFEIEVDEEPEAEAPAPAKKKSSSKKEPKEPKEKKEPKPKKEKKPKKPTKKSRRNITCEILRRKKNHSVEELIDTANNEYAAQGGKDNYKEAAFIVHRVIDILEDFGNLERDGDKIKLS